MYGRGSGMEVLKQQITVGSRRIQATWSMEAMKDLMMAHGMADGLHWFFHNDIMWHEILPDDTIED